MLIVGPSGSHHSVFPYVAYSSIGPPGNADTTTDSEHAMDSAPQLLSSLVRRVSARPWVASRHTPLDRALLLELPGLLRHDHPESLALQSPPAPLLSPALPLHDHHLIYQGAYGCAIHVRHSGRPKPGVLLMSCLTHALMT